MWSIICTVSLQSGLAAQGVDRETELMAPDFLYIKSKLIFERLLILPICDVFFRCGLDPWRRPDPDVTHLTSNQNQTQHPN